MLFKMFVAKVVCLFNEYMYLNLIARLGNFVWLPIAPVGKCFDELAFLG